MEMVGFGIDRATNVNADVPLGMHNTAAIS